MNKNLSVKVALLGALMLGANGLSAEPVGPKAASAAFWNSPFGKGAKGGAALVGSVWFSWLTGYSLARGLSGNMPVNDNPMGWSATLVGLGAAGAYTAASLGLYGYRTTRSAMGMSQASKAVAKKFPQVLKGLRDLQASMKSE